MTGRSGANRRKACSKGLGTKEYIRTALEGRARAGSPLRARSTRRTHEFSNLSWTQDEPTGPSPPATERTQPRPLAPARTRNQPKGAATPATEQTQSHVRVCLRLWPEIAERTQFEAEARPRPLHRSGFQITNCVEIHPDQRGPVRSTPGRDAGTKPGYEPERTQIWRPSILRNEPWRRRTSGPGGLSAWCLARYTQPSGRRPGGSAT